MRSAKPLLAAILCAPLMACAGLSAGPRAPISSLDNFIVGDAGLQASYSAAALNECFGFALLRQAEQARECRDRITQALVTGINLRFAEFELGFFDANRYTGLATNVAVLGLTAAGAVSGAGAAQALSAAATAMTGTRTAISRELLQEQTSAALLTAMRAQRNIAELRIRQGLQLSAVEYPLVVALSDAHALYRAGTIPGALAGVTQAVGVQGAAAQADLVVGNGLARGPAATALREWVRAGGEGLLRQQRIRAVLQAARDLGLSPPDAASFLRNNTPENEANLARVARRLGVFP